MKRLCVLVGVLAAILAVEGCKKREPKPAPQVETTRVAADTIPPVGPVAQRLVQGTHQ